MRYGYCGNVHPGRTLDEVQRNLVQHAVLVKRALSSDESLPFGLWLSATAAQELADPFRRAAFRDWLVEHGLIPFTFNGFPFGDFHQSVVKHSVYRPTWADSSRLEYTNNLADIQNALLPAGLDGTISTLPLGWRDSASDQDEGFLKECGANLRRCARYLHQIFEKTGRSMVVCIEPEPGCILDRCEDVVDFFERFLKTQDASSNEITMRHIGVCHDVCHSAVMFEDQRTAIEEYRNAGIHVGKIQISSALAVDFSEKSESDRADVATQLKSFCEPRYLHQTSIYHAGDTTFFENLPDAIANREFDGEWRVHFHVPIFAETLGAIGTTQSDIGECLDAVRQLGMETEHFEIETYAWNVLPAKWQEDSLWKGIAREIEWFRDSFV